MHGVSGQRSEQLQPIPDGVRLPPLRLGAPGLSLIAGGLRRSQLPAESLAVAWTDGTGNGSLSAPGLSVVVLACWLLLIRRLRSGIAGWLLFLLPGRLLSHIHRGLLRRLLCVVRLLRIGGPGAIGCSILTKRPVQLRIVLGVAEEEAVVGSQAPGQLLAHALDDLLAHLRHATGSPGPDIDRRVASRP